MNNERKQYWLNEKAKVESLVKTGMTKSAACQKLGYRIDTYCHGVKAAGLTKKNQRPMQIEAPKRFLDLSDVTKEMKLTFPSGLILTGSQAQIT